MCYNEAVQHQTRFAQSPIYHIKRHARTISDYVLRRLAAHWFGLVFGWRLGQASQNGQVFVGDYWLPRLTMVGWFTVLNPLVCGQHDDYINNGVGRGHQIDDQMWYITFDEVNNHHVY